MAVGISQKKHGRPLLLGSTTDARVQAYIRKVREGGGTISIRVVMAAARGILRSSNLKSLEGTFT